MQTDKNIAEPDYNSIELQMNLPADLDNDIQIIESEPKHDHHTSAMYAASHAHSAVHHVKPHHSTRIEL